MFFEYYYTGIMLKLLNSQMMMGMCSLPKGGAAKAL